jgi:hypothetical protein
LDFFFCIKTIETAVTSIRPSVVGPAPSFPEKIRYGVGRKVLTTIVLEDTPVQKVALWSLELYYSSYYVLLCICSFGCPQFDN